MKALLLIDIQSGLQETAYYGTERNNPHAEENCAKILKAFRNKKFPVFHVIHNSTNPASPLYPGKKGNSIHPLVEPIEGEPVFQKKVNSAFIGTDLEIALIAQNITDLVIVGLTIEHCISTSVRMAANLGFHVTLISDATAAFDKIGFDGKRYPAELIYQTELANLKDEFALIQNTSNFLTELDN
ncbi:cysteine hydrolase family protein [Flagellimonas pelagia]|uniref:Cysteine hydrolase n=1 Tax=Flagellimonas pelagia TaxID=2306998 RepID=A0A3A1NGQ8_9FLAO|nr:cysteine hydrolase family protein [Allomuricauda maritima]RIV44311.1 cysteine hydrolase [Allomuricauda maritima]TXJ93931.1 cysteine hydrolase [Allomuricauda maritima]